MLPGSLLGPSKLRATLAGMKSPAQVGQGRRLHHCKSGGKRSSCIDNTYARCATCTARGFRFELTARGNAALAGEGGRADVEGRVALEQRPDAPEPWRQRRPRVARDFSYRNAIDARVIYWPAGARVFITSRNQTFKERRWNLSRAAAARPPGGGEDSGNGRERRASVCRRNNGQGRYPRVCPNPYYANEMGVL